MPAKKRKPELKELQFMLRVGESELDAWKAAAAADGRTVSAWLRWLAAKAVESAKELQSGKR